MRPAAITLEQVDVFGVDTLKRAEGIKQILFNYHHYMENVRVPILRDLSLRVQAGEKLGVVGRNGSGKSSLLKVIAGIYPPQRGRVQVIGRVSPLIEMGVGAENEFTGRQNIKIGLLYSGQFDSYSPELEQRIIEFSGLGEKIDLPLKAYSSGMKARLAFSVAIFQDADILLLDEAFATGDAEFIERSYHLMQERLREVPILVLVAHGTQMIEEFCTRCLWLEGGRIAADGSPREVIQEYFAAQKVSQGYALA